MTKHLSQDQRRESILTAAMSIFCESGLEAINMSALSARTRVSRQLIYGHFGNVDEVLEALFEHTFENYFERMRPYDPILELVGDQGPVRFNGILDLPDPVRRLGAIAFFSGTHTRPFLRRFRNRFDGLLEHRWIMPLVEGGLDRMSATSAVYATIASSFECGDLIDRGIITRFDAESQLAMMSDSMPRATQHPIMSLAN